MDPITHLYQLLKLAYPFQGQPRFNSVLIPILEEIQVCEDILTELRRLQDIDEQDWLRLTYSAGLVGQPVTTDDLETLRRLVKTRPLVNRSSGTRPELAVIAKMLVPDATRFQWSTFDGGVELTIYGGTNVDSTVASVLQEAMSSDFLLRVLAVPAGGGFSFGGSIVWGDGYFATVVA